MKKIVLLILVLIPVNVNAITYFTKYVYEGDGENPKEETELLKVEQEKRYQNCYYLKQNEGYYLLNHNPYYLDHVNYNDYQITDGYSYAYNASSIGPMATYRIYSISQAKYFFFRSFQKVNAKISKITFLYEEKEIPYKVLSSNYNNTENLEYNTEFVLELDNEYNLKTLKIRIEFFNPNLERVAFSIKAFSQYYDGSPYFSHFPVEVIKHKTNDILEMNFLLPNEFDLLISKIGWIYQKPSDYNYVNYYLNKVKLYKYYSVFNQCLNEFSKEKLKDNYYLSTFYKIYYLYYKRDYINVIDEITNPNDINKLILSSSIETNKIKLESNLNINVNGEYLIKISYLNNTFFHKIVVNIKENERNETTTTNKVVLKKVIKMNYTIIKTTSNKIILSKKIIKNEKPLQMKHYYHYEIFIIQSILVILLLIRQKNKN